MGMITCLAAGILSGCKEQAEINENGEEVVWLTWYQVGDEQKDDQMVLDAVNDYTFEKIGVHSWRSRTPLCTLTSTCRKLSPPNGFCSASSKRR